MIADEIQSGLARTGKMLACDWEEVRPDVVVRPYLTFSFDEIPVLFHVNITVFGSYCSLNF